MIYSLQLHHAHHSMVAGLDGTGLVRDPTAFS